MTRQQSPPAKRAHSAGHSRTAARATCTTTCRVSLTLSLSLSHTLSHSLTLSHTLSRSLTLSHTLTLSHSHTLTLSHSTPTVTHNTHRCEEYTAALEHTCTRAASALSSCARRWGFTAAFLTSSLRPRLAGRRVRTLPSLCLLRSVSQEDWVTSAAAEPVVDFVDTAYPPSFPSFFSSCLLDAGIVFSSLFLLSVWFPRK